jgi:hypothetical protein
MMMWPPGFALFQNKLTTTVVHKALPIVLDGHNCGYMLPHISIPVANALTPLQMAFSSRKVVFAASKVKANGTAIGCVYPSFLLPMTCCAQPVTLPNGISLLNIMNTVIVGTTWVDFFLGWLSIAATMYVDKRTHSAPKEMTTKGELLKNVTADARWKVLLGDKPEKALGKAVAGAIAGAAKIVLTDEGSISIAAGSNYVGIGLSYSQTRDIHGMAASGNLVTHQGSAEKVWKADGSSTTTLSTKEASLDDRRVLADGVTQTSTRTFTKFDQDGHVTETTATKTTSRTDQSPWSGSTESDQQQTTTKPGQAPETSTSHSNSAARWGTPL